MLSIGKNNVTKMMKEFYEIVRMRNTVVCVKEIGVEIIEFCDWHI